MDTLGKRIMLVRGKEPQEAYAARIGVSKASIGGYERDINLPSSEVIVKICQADNISAKWLLMGQGEMNESVSQSFSGTMPSLELQDLKNQVKVLKREIVLLTENLKAKDESLGLYRQMLTQAQKALSAEKENIQSIDTLAFSPSASLIEQDSK